MGDFVQRGRRDVESRSWLTETFDFRQGLAEEGAGAFGLGEEFDEEAEHGAVAGGVLEDHVHLDGGVLEVDAVFARGVEMVVS